MLKFLPPFLKLPLAGILLALNTIFWCLLIYPLATLKVLLPLPRVRRVLTGGMVVLAECWIRINGWQQALLYPIRFKVQGLECLRPDRSYLVTANHQSWVDILVLQHVLNRRIPFLRFFLKWELIYVPFLNIAWWALDYPFMRRRSKEFLARHPEKRGEDMATTQRACRRFRGSPLSVLNFLEGTRRTKEKHRAQASPHRHLLRPKAGGLAFVLQAMGDQFDSLLDVTIYYPEGPMTFIEMLAGRLHEVVVHIERIEIPPNFLMKSYEDDEVFRRDFQAWVRELWERKDRRLDELSAPSSRAGGSQDLP